MRFLIINKNHIFFRWWAYNKHHIWYESMTLTSEYFTGTIATLGFLFIFVTAFEYIRRNHFEVFYYTHIIGYIIAMVGSLTHEISCIYYFTPAIILWVADRIYRSYQSWCVPSSLESIEPVSNNIMRIRFKYDRLKLLAPGQYVFMAFSHNRNNLIHSHQSEEEGINNYQNRKKDHYKENRWWFLNWYPMTVAQINRKIKWDKNTLLPRISNSSVETSATIYIKALGDFTKSLYDASASGQINRFKVDGPYGPKLDTYQDHHVMACFATGVGVTPALALIQDCINRRSVGTSTVLTSTIYLFFIIRYAGKEQNYTFFFSYLRKNHRDEIEFSLNTFKLCIRRASTLSGNS